MDQDVFPFSNLTDSNLICLLNDSVPHHFPLHIIDNLIYKPFEYYDCDNATNSLITECNIFEPTCNYLFCDDPDIISNESPLSKFISF